MATTTNNLGLKKPEQSDFYNIEDFNENFEKIDESIGETKEEVNQLNTNLAKCNGISVYTSIAQLGMSGTAYLTDLATKIPNKSILWISESELKSEMPTTYGFLEVKKFDSNRTFFTWYVSNNTAKGSFYTSSYHSDSGMSGWTKVV